MPEIEPAMVAPPSSLNVPFNDLARLYHRNAATIEAEVIAVLRSGWWINGTRARAFTESFAEFIGVPHCVPVANGTDALELALRAVSAGTPGKNEVVTVANAGVTRRPRFMPPA